MAATVPDVPPEPPAPRKPRKVFLLVGVVVAAALGVGLFTSLGTTSSATSGPPHAGGDVPSFSATNLNGAGTVQVSADAAHGTPTVILFFGNWCEACHTELPPLAAAVRQQRVAGGALSRIRVIGVDSEDTVGNAKSFIKNSGVTFPVAYDPNVSITSGDFYFTGDPHTVFVNGSGKIVKVVDGDQLSPAAFSADERALTPSGR
ncbi:MAG TPA: TlpA disulfide reductase family protein [Acidimicrobiales bacterium]|jgi:peroxiredoxin|nr:TlpA disulfide reductase family protein [Acidimicrobiales bacterium]